MAVEPTDWLSAHVVVDETDPKRVTLDVNLDCAVNLSPDLQLTAFSVHVSRDGVILWGNVDLSEVDTSLSVSPESLEAPPDEGWQG